MRSKNGFAGSTRARAMHRLPIAGQVALTLLLLGGAGGAGKAFLTRVHAPHGFDPNHVLVVSTSVAQQLPTAPTTKQQIQAMETARQDVAQAPGVAEAGFSMIWSPGLLGALQGIEIRSKPALNNAEAVIDAISPQLLSVLRVPVLRGRTFDGAEVQRQAHVAMVNQAFCKQYLGALDPIGQRIRIPKLRLNSSSSGRTADDWMEVIGVAGDATNGALDHGEVRPAVFIPYASSGISGGLLFARVSDDPATAIRSIRARLPDEVVYAHTLKSELDSWGWGSERMMTEVFGLYAGIALVLAAAGLYGVVSFAVTQRSHELGIRMALGAGRGAAVRLVLASTAAMLGLGLVAGFIISAILTPIISAWGGGSLFAPFNLFGASLILVIAAAIACAFSAWRAASIDPMKVLRAE